jgi:hypothetical protein
LKWRTTDAATVLWARSREVVRDHRNSRRTWVFLSLVFGVLGLEIFTEFPLCQFR